MQKLTKQQKQAFTTFLEYADASRLSRNLRKMLILYLQAEQLALPTYTDDLLYDLYILFELLDEVGEV